MSSRNARIAHLVVVNAFVGAMVGLERTVLPLVAEEDFGIASKAAALAFIATFGVTKAVMNAVAGALSERWGRKKLLLAGWLLGVPVPLMIAYAPAWGWILVANVVLGINQALTWSMTVVMKVDLAETRRYGLVIGLNEFSGYTGMAAAAAATGWLASRYALRPEPFYLGAALAIAGLLVSALARETAPSSAATTREDDGGARTGARTSGNGASTSTTEEATAPQGGVALSLSEVMARSVWKDPRLAVASLSGLATNLKDGVLWGLLPILLASRDVPLQRIGIVVALYPLVWAGSQLLFGPLSDRTGRRPLIVGGMAVQGIGVALFLGAESYPGYLLASTAVGLGTGMVYPTLLAFVSEEAGTLWRATALGVYRFWRDLGYAVGALGGGLVADRLDLSASLAATAAVAVLAGLAFLAGTRR